MAAERVIQQGRGNHGQREREIEREGERSALGKTTKYRRSKMEKSMKKKKKPRKRRERRVLKCAAMTVRRGDGNDDDDDDDD